MTRVYADAADKSRGTSKTAAMSRQIREAPAPPAADPQERYQAVAEGTCFRAEQSIGASCPGTSFRTGWIRRPSSSSRRHDYRYR
jgi:hypothetical protein